MNWSNGSPVPMEWVVSGAGDSVGLYDSKGAPVPLETPPQKIVDGTYLVIPPILPGGVYTLSSAGSEKEIQVPGFDFAAAVYVEETGSTFGAVALGGASVGLLVLAFALLLIRRRPAAGASLVAALLAGLGAGFMLYAQDTSLAAGVPAETRARAIVGCPVDSPAARSECAGPHITASLLEGGPRAAMGLVELVSQTAAVDCHDLAHDAGRATWLSSRSADVVATVDNPGSCEFGYAHGALEGASVMEDSEGLLRVANDVCGRFLDAANATSDAQALNIGGQCYHGLGHALIKRTAARLDLTESACARVTVPRFAEQCRIGAYMEWGRLWGLGRSGTGASPPGPESPLDLCDGYEGELIEECYYGAAVSVTVPGQGSKLVSWCNGNAAGASLTPCLKGVIRSFPSRDGDVARTVKYCSDVGADLEEWCIAQMARSFLANHRNDPEGLCLKFAEHRDLCISAVKEQLEYFASSGDRAVQPAS